MGSLGKAGAQGLPLRALPSTGQSAKGFPFLSPPLYPNYCRGTGEETVPLGKLRPKE